MGIRVAHIISSLSIGGAERNFVNLLNALPCDYKAAVFLGQVRPESSFYGDLDDDVEQVVSPVRRRSALIDIPRLVRALRHRKLDVVHTHMFESSLYGCIAAKIAGVPVVVTSEHGENPNKSRLARWLERRLISSIADRRYCVSQPILEARRDRDGVRPELLKLVANGTSVPETKPAAAENTVPIVGAVGRFITAKDYPCLINAAALLRERQFDFKLVILGDGPEMPAVLRAINQLGLGDIVSLPGMVPNVNEWYSKFDIYVSSSLREGQPVAMLEAMAHGLAIVATDVGAVACTVQDRISGIVVPPRSAEQLAEGIGQVLESEPLRLSLGRNAHARALERYSVQAIADSQVEQYKELLGRAVGESVGRR